MLRSLRLEIWTIKRDGAFNPQCYQLSEGCQVNWLSNEKVHAAFAHAADSLRIVRWSDEFQKFGDRDRQKGKHREQWTDKTNPRQITDELIAGKYFHRI